MPLTYCLISVAADKYHVVLHDIKNIWLCRNDDIHLKKEKQASVRFALVSSHKYLVSGLDKLKIRLCCTHAVYSCHKQLCTYLNVHILLSGGVRTENSENYWTVETLPNPDTNGMSHFFSNLRLKFALFAFAQMSVFSPYAWLARIKTPDQ